MKSTNWLDTFTDNKNFAINAVSDLYRLARVLKRVGNETLFTEISMYAHEIETAVETMNQAVSTMIFDEAKAVTEHTDQMLGDIMASAFKTK